MPSAQLITIKPTGNTPDPLSFSYVDISDFLSSIAFVLF